MPKIDVALINLASSTDRLASFSAQAKREGMEFRRVDAVDMRGETVSEKHNAQATKHYGRPLKAGEVGCFLSHIKTMKSFLDSDSDLLLFFEDDAELSVGFWDITQCVAADMTHELAPPWWMVCLGNGPKRKYALPLRAYNSGETSTMLERSLSYPVLAHAQLVSREGAAAMMAYADQLDMPIDQIYARDISRKGMGFALTPPIAKQSGEESDIDSRGLREGDPMGVIWRKWPRKWRTRIDAEWTKSRYRQSDAGWIAALDS